MTIMWSLEGITAALAANGRARMAARLLGAVETRCVVAEQSFRVGA